MEQATDDKPIKENRIEPSKTARASCKECGGVIGKGELRFCLVDFSFSEHGSYKYLHLACAQKRRPAELAQTLEKGSFDVPRAEIDAALAAVTEAAQASSAVAPPWLDLAKGGELPPFAADVDPPKTREGTVPSPAMVAKLVAAMKDPKATTTLERFEAWLDPDALRAFSLAIFERWARSGGHMREKWLFKQIARDLDAASARKLGTILEQWLKVNRRPAAEAAIEVLEANASDAALGALQALAQRFGYKGGANLALASLERVARARGVATADLEDQLVPRLDGASFDYGPRRFQLRVGPDLRPELVDEDGAVLHGLPPARKTDDAAKVTVAKRALEVARADLDATLKAQAARLEHALSNGRLWEPETWRTNLVAHPVLVRLVRRLVWASFDDEGPPITFVVDATGTPRLEDGEELELPEGKIGLVHPVELSAETRTRWQAVLGEAKLAQPFPQLARPIYLLPASDADGDTLASYEKRPIAPGPLHGVLNRAGWVKSVPEDMRVHHFHKRFETQGVTGVIRLDPGLSVQMGDDTPQLPAEAFFIREKGMGWDDLEKLPLTDVPKVALSEVLHDLDILANRS